MQITRKNLYNLLIYFQMKLCHLVKLSVYLKAHLKKTWIFLLIPFIKLYMDNPIPDYMAKLNTKIFKNENIR